MKRGPRDYVLGVNSAEIERLALQHRVWRERALGLWRRAGLRTGASVLDVGCGPGWATVDLAEMVGPAGRVVAVDRAPEFLAHAHALAAERRLTWLQTREIELPEPLAVDASIDFAWCRWVLAFTKDPAAVLASIATAVRPGGVLAIQEYAHYRAWSLLPAVPGFTRFVEAVIDSWRDEGGEPDVALELPALLDRSGFDLLAFDAFVDVLESDDFAWQWPASFARSGASRLVELGKLTDTEAKAACMALEAAAAHGQRMITPVTAQLIARRR
jgi:SAM-dependent methyltransferase